MSAKRKLSRHSSSRKPSEGKPDKRTLRRQTSGERFQKPGSERLWEALLGWDELRVRRIWLAQGLHDIAKSQANDPAEALARFVDTHLPGVEVELDPERLGTAISIWAEDADGYDPDDPAPKWHLLANLCERLDWGTASAEALQHDWETWTNLTLAGRPRAVLMQLLQETERATVELNQLTESDNVSAVANVSRALWYALAYGDEATFAQLRDWSRQFTPKLPGH